MKKVLASRPGAFPAKCLTRVTWVTVVLLMGSSWFSQAPAAANRTSRSKTAAESFSLARLHFAAPPQRYWPRPLWFWLEARCRVEGSHMVLPGNIHPGRFSVVILPGHNTIRWTTLAKLGAFYDQGGGLIATGELPSKSAEFGRDAEVVREVDRLFGNRAGDRESATPLGVRRNPAGGVAIRLSGLSADRLRTALDTARGDYDVAFERGRALRYIHKVWQGRHLYFLANLDPDVSESVVTLRGELELEAWDPHTGEIRAVPRTQLKRGELTFTQVPLRLPHRRSVFLVSGVDREEGGLR